MGEPVTLTAANFDAHATRSDIPLLVDFWASWCGPCRQVAPILERLSVRYAGEVKVVKVNVDDNRITATRFDASSIPTLIMMRDGQTAGTAGVETGEVGGESGDCVEFLGDAARTGRDLGTRE